MPHKSKVKESREFDFSRKHFDELRKKAKAYSGIHVTDDKYEMYYSRLAKRLRALKLTNFAEYLVLLDKDPLEFKEFINAITTNVTSFNREQHHFEYLKKEIDDGQRRSLSIWSAGCSSGEEPYSIILNLYHCCQNKSVPFNIKATDLDTDVLQRAANGIYKTDAIDMYDAKTKRTFFLKGVAQNNGKCRVKKSYREIIEFEQLNLIKDWQFDTPFDVIFCRNVMIYFDAEQKEKIIRKYADHLVPGGLLFLGHSESLHNVDAGFESVGKTIYKKRG